jgi:proteasome regulatory subunit
MLDPALLRPGRFDRVIEIPLPDNQARRKILQIHTSRMLLEGVDLDKIVTLTENTTGAELQAICREAGMMAVRRDATGISQDDFIRAVHKVRNEVIFDGRMYT